MMPRFIAELVEFDGKIESDQGFSQLNSTRQSGPIRFKRDFGVFKIGQTVDNLTFDFEHGELIVYSDDCERDIVQSFGLLPI